MSIAALWFRRDLRLEDHTALYHALQSGKKILPVFIFDCNILDELDKHDQRVSFIYQQLQKLNELLKEHGASFYVAHGNPIAIWKEIHEKFELSEIYFNRDY